MNIQEIKEFAQNNLNMLRTKLDNAKNIGDITQYIQIEKEIEEVKLLIEKLN